MVVPALPKVPEGKAVIFAYIDEDLLERFKNEVKKVFGGHKGALSEAIEEAIRMWLAVTKYGPRSEERENTHIFSETRKDGRRGGERVAKEAMALWSKLLDEVEPGASIHKKYLMNLAMKTLGLSTWRSVEKRIEYLISEGLLERDPSDPKRLFKVVGYEAEKARRVSRLQVPDLR